MLFKDARRESRGKYRSASLNLKRFMGAAVALRATLFRGDTKLEAAASIDASHIVPGSRGPHVGKIQTALNRLDSAGLSVDEIYGPRTANAVLSYKRKRGIINRSYQTSPDDIVGKMTMASLDDEMHRERDLEPLEITVTGDKPRVYFSSLQGRPSTRLAFGFDAGIADAGAPSLRFSSKFTRWSPSTTGTVRCAETGNSSLALCTNEQDPSREGSHPPKSKVAFLSDMASPSNMAQFPKPEDGGRVQLKRDPHVMRLETFRPGDSTISVTRGDTARMLIVEVRQDAKGKVARAPLTKLTKGSSFFSASLAEGGEEDPAGFCSGRPVNPKRGGRLINLGGETETPEFEDYQVDLDHSWGNIGGFRPWVDDFGSPSVFIPSKSASHITMRGTPLEDSFVSAIKRIAQPGCRFTYNGPSTFFEKIKSKLPGHKLDEPIFEPDEFILLAWELN